MLLIGIVCVVAVILGENIDKFLALLGAFACVPVAFTMPALFHYRLSAKTKK
jgi:amino acid permease